MAQLRIAPAHETQAQPRQQGPAAVLEGQQDDTLGQRLRQTAPADVRRLTEPHLLLGVGGLSAEAGDRGSHVATEHAGNGKRPVIGAGRARPWRGNDATRLTRLCGVAVCCRGMICWTRFLETQHAQHAVICLSHVTDCAGKALYKSFEQPVTPYPHWYSVRHRLLLLNHSCGRSQPCSSALATSALATSDTLEQEQIAGPVDVRAAETALLAMALDCMQQVLAADLVGRLALQPHVICDMTCTAISACPSTRLQAPGGRNIEWEKSCESVQSHRIVRTGSVSRG